MVKGIPDMTTPCYLIMSVIVFMAFSGFLSSSADEVRPGVKPPDTILKQVRPALERGREALAAKDAEATQKAVQEAVEILGPWAGNPETATRYFPPIDQSSFPVTTVRERWFREFDRGKRGLPWLKNSKGDPTRMQAGLREAAWPLDTLARTAMLFPERREELTVIVRQGADWLVSLQHSSGVFPFPVGPGLNPRDKVGHIVARAMKEYPEIVVGGWIPDASDGGLQFDNGLCGRALISAWELTREEKYLEAARKSGGWAMSRPLVSNWNYNAFSVGLLARLATATAEAKYLDAAVEKAQIGVLPGQMATGRWFDAHNACAVYHNILMRELLELFHALPKDHPFRPTVSDSIRRQQKHWPTDIQERGPTILLVACSGSAKIRHGVPPSTSVSTPAARTVPRPLVSRQFP